MPTDQPQGFLALPKSRQGPGVLVLHAWWGLNPFFKDFCQRLADEGFIAYAPDLHHGKIATTIAEAEQLDAQLDVERTLGDVNKGIDYLKGVNGVTGPVLGLIGFSLGAFLGLQVSRDRPDDIGAVVLFYGTNAGDFAASRAAYLGHYAENDPFEPPESVKQLEARLQQANRPVTFYTYNGTGHWFFEKDRVDAYHAEAAELAWQRTIEFLRTNLGRGNSGNP